MQQLQDGDKMSEELEYYDEELSKSKRFLNYMTGVLYFWTAVSILLIAVGYIIFVSRI